MNPLFPREYQIGMERILKPKYPKYFTGKFHPKFYIYTPTQQHNYIKVTKSIKIVKTILEKPNPYYSKSYELYYFRNQRDIKAIQLLDFSGYTNVQLNFYQKSFLKNYFWALNSLEKITISLSNHDQFYIKFLDSWIKRQQSLKILNLIDFSTDNAIPEDFIKNLLQSVSQTLKKFSYKGYSASQVNFIGEINSCKSLESFDIQGNGNIIDQTLLLKFDCSRFKKFFLDSSYCNPKIYISILKQLKICEDLTINLPERWNYANNQEIQEVCQSIPKKLKSLFIKFDVRLNSYEAFSNIVVENEFGIKNFNAIMILDHSKILKNKENIRSLDIDSYLIDVHELKNILMSFTLLEKLSLSLNGYNLDQDWPLTFGALFDKIKIKSFSLEFDTSKTRLESIISLLGKFLNGGHIQEIELTQTNFGDPCLPLLQFFANEQKKNFFLHLRIDDFDPIIQSYKEQFRRYKWIIEKFLE